MKGLFWVGMAWGLCLAGGAGSPVGTEDSAAAAELTEGKKAPTPA